MRLSNYLLWQTAYSEFYFTDVLWPDFGKKDIEKALIDYSRRNRRFGGL
jgi:undecaprenyl diphosphate synthase